VPSAESNRTEGDLTLAQQKCEPCQIGTPPLAREQALELLKSTPGWTLKDSSIERAFRFDDFRGSVAFVNRVADLAEDEGHHPDISIHHSKVRLEITTHKINGLSRNDFILAAKIGELI
jgi:4a-hydroxytetrahydrobiopterin dehydratase